MEPSVGRIVHYVSYGTPNGEYPSVCRAAIITELDETYSADEGDGEQTDLNLCVLNPEGLFFNRYVKEDQTTKRGGTWHWPEFVSGK